MTTRYKLTIAYQGTRYCGWQVQINGLAIQPLVQQAIETILRHSIDLTGSSRTDAQVHAAGQTAHFDTDISITPKFLLSLNALLPPDIRVRAVEPVAPDFHARYSAKSKIYHYHLHLDPVMDPFKRHIAHHIRAHFDLGSIEKGTQEFIGTRDFTAFANHADQGIAARDPIRTLKRLDVIPQKGGIRLEFEADGFLYKMVRNITGALIDIGRGKLNSEAIAAIFNSKDRRCAPMTAPAHGLILQTVNYL